MGDKDIVPLGHRCNLEAEFFVSPFRFPLIFFRSNFSIN